MELKIKKETAKTVYGESPVWFQKVLTETFGEDCFKKIDFNEIKTFDDACKVCGTTELEFKTRFGNLGLDPDTINYEKVKIIAKAINRGWVPKWDNMDEPKYYPWFKVSPSGGGFSYSGYSTYSDTSVGSPLCFETSEKAKYAANQFGEIYNQFLL
jgi:hypothetical protein